MTIGPARAVAVLYGVTTDSLLGGGENDIGMPDTADPWGDDRTVSVRERFEHYRALLREHPYDCLLLARFLETTFTHLFNVDEEERDALVADAEALVTACGYAGSVRRRAPRGRTMSPCPVFVSPLRILSCGLCGISGELEGCYRRLGDREVSDTLYDVQWQMIKAVYGDNECPYPLEDFYQEALI